MKMDRETEFMICMKEQGFTNTLDGKTISFPIENMMVMWDILNDKPKQWEIKYPNGNIVTTNYDPFDEHKENIERQKENKKLINKWHNMVVTGMVNGLTHTIWDGRRDDINWVRSRGNLWEAFGRCVFALSVGNDYKSDERDLKEISKEGYKI